MTGLEQKPREGQVQQYQQAPDAQQRPPDEPRLTFHSLLVALCHHQRLPYTYIEPQRSNPRAKLTASAADAVPIAI